MITKESFLNMYKDGSFPSYHNHVLERIIDEALEKAYKNYRKGDRYVDLKTEIDYDSYVLDPHNKLGHQIYYLLTNKHLFDRKDIEIRWWYDRDPMRDSGKILIRLKVV